MTKQIKILKTPIKSQRLSRSLIGAMKPAAIETTAWLPAAAVACSIAHRGLEISQLGRIHRTHL